MHVFCAVTTRMRIPFVERYERWSSTCGRNIVVLNWKRRKISRWSHSYVMGCLGTVRSKPQIQSECSTLIRRRCPVKNVVIRWHDVSTQPTALGDAHMCSYGWCRATWCGASHNPQHIPFSSYTFMQDDSLELPNQLHHEVYINDFMQNQRSPVLDSPRHPKRYP